MPLDCVRLRVRPQSQSIWVRPTGGSWDPAAGPSTRLSPKPIGIMAFGLGRAGVQHPVPCTRISEIDQFAATRAGRGAIGDLFGNMDAGMALGADNDNRSLSGPLVAGPPRSANRFLARRTMHQGPFHLWPDHEALTTARTLVNTQRRGNGNRRLAVGTLDRHASTCFINDEVMAAGFAFEVDIWHWLTSRGRTVSLGAGTNKLSAGLGRHLCQLVSSQKHKSPTLVCSGQCNRTDRVSHRVGKPSHWLAHICSSTR
jgi:hypothetical protein